MSLVALVFAVFAFWTLISLLDAIFKKIPCHLYIAILKRCGISLSFCHFRLTWEHLPMKLMKKLRFHNGQFLTLWFDFGVVATLLTVPTSCFILLSMTASLFTSQSRSSHGEVLEIVVPGVNLPINDLFYYLLALITASVIHEMGHGLAAIVESVKVQCFGLHIFGIVPAAYVELPTDQVMAIPDWPRLRIICGGVWHNIVLGTMAAFLLLSNSLLLSPFYDVDHGAVVAHVNPHSAFYGDTGLQVGDVITSFNHRFCVITNKASWVSCLREVARKKTEGLCTSINFISEESMPSGNEMCCTEGSRKELCFEEADTKAHHCLPARKLITSFAQSCNTTKECPVKHHCLYPFTDIPFLKLTVIHREEGQPFLFWGHPSEIYNSLTIVDYKPKSSFLPLTLLHYYESFLRYLCSFSLGLAIINALPCLWLDGKWIMDAALRYFFPHILFSSRQILINVSCYTGSFLLAACTVVGVYRITSK